MLFLSVPLAFSLHFLSITLAFFLSRSSCSERYVACPSVPVRSRAPGRDISAEIPFDDIVRTPVSSSEEEKEQEESTQMPPRRRNLHHREQLALASRTKQQHKPVLVQRSQAKLNKDSQTCFSGASCPDECMRATSVSSETIAEDRSGPSYALWLCVSRIVFPLELGN